MRCNPRYSNAKTNPQESWTPPSSARERLLRALPQNEIGARAFSVQTKGRSALPRPSHFGKGEGRGEGRASCEARLFEFTHNRSCKKPRICLAHRPSLTP